MAIVYLHRRKDDNSVFYVGIGLKEKRAFSANARNNYWKNIVNYVGYEVQITHKELCWEEACVIEKYLISFYGRNDLGNGRLCNLTDGGDGIVNFIITNEIRKKISQYHKGRKKEKEWVVKMKKWLCNENIMKSRKTTKGYKMSYEQKERLRLFNIGKKHTNKTKEKIRIASIKEKNQFYGKTHSEESKLKMKLNHKNRIEVTQFDLFGNKIKTYNSLREAERETKISHIIIKRCCLNKNKKINGFTWEIKQNKNEQKENTILG
jgi:hypothetical protein